jgi:hypothetical protein
MSKLEILKHWKKVIQQHDKETQRVKTNFELDSGSALLATLYKMTDEYIKMTEIAVGDENGWLGWYWCEADMGKSPRRVVLRDRTMYEVKTLAQLLYVIEQDTND